MKLVQDIKLHVLFVKAKFAAVLAYSIGIFSEHAMSISSPSNCRFTY